MRKLRTHHFSAGAPIILALATLAGVATAQAPEEAISRIRERYAAVNQSGLRYTTVARQLDNYAVEGADLTGFFLGSELRKIVARYFAESGFGREEYYFWNAELFFVFRQKNRASQLHPDLEGVAENRFYFASRKLIRWVDENGRLVVVDQPAAREEERHLLSEAGKFAQMLIAAAPAQQPQQPQRASPRPLESAVPQRLSIEGQTRAQLAAQHQEAFRSDGCGSCRVWVGGSDNQTLYVLDPQAPEGNNDYRGTPTFWYTAGFTEVVYFSKPGVVYARHRK